MQRTISLALLVILMPALASAHSADGIAGGALSGFLHPLKGLDHLVAMVAVGLWGAQLGRPLIYVLPVAFPLVMALGGLMGIVGLPMIGVELGIALSALVLGVAVALAFRAPLYLAVLIVAAFAIFHGYAHGTELPEAAAPLAYGIGFVVATGLLHLAGIVIGLLNERPGFGPMVVRGGGVAIALIGVYFTGAALGVV